MLQDRIEAWYERVGKKVVHILLAIMGVYIFFKYILGLVAPFVVAWILASMLNPVVTFLNKRLKLARGLGTLLSMLTILTAFFGALTFLIKQLWEQIVSFSSAFPIYKDEIVQVINGLENELHAVTNKLPIPKAISSLDNIISQLLDSVGGFLGKIGTQTVEIVTKVPNGLFFLIIMLIATFFMTKDNYKIKRFIKAQISPKVIQKMRLMKKGLKGALGGYIKTQLILMCFTFGICLIGLYILKQNYVLLISFAIAIFDAFPMLGSGAILIPWAIYNLILGRYGLGIGLLCIYGLIVITRQFTEPKVLSSQIGVYALITVMAMYVGFKSIGVLGIIIGPVLVVMIQTLQKIGILPQFKNPDDPKHDR